MNKGNIRRRKWAFEKGRNSGALLLLPAAAAVAIVLLLTTTLRYGFTPPTDRRQITELSLLPPGELNALQLIREFDPAETYRINSGGYPFCLNCRRSHDNFCTSDDVKEFFTAVENADRRPDDLRDKDPLSRIRKPEPRNTDFPVSTALAPVLPVNELPELPELRVLDENGREIAVDKQKLAPINPTGRRNTAVLEIFGEGLVSNVKIITSCGNPAADLKIGNILKAHNVKPGVYTVCWADRRSEP